MEIWFKGKRKDNGEWVEGYYAKTVDICGRVYCFILTGEMEYTKEIVAHSIVDVFSPVKIYVLENTICRYTGLQDKNKGKKFEGDIFQADDGEYIQRYIIAWDENLLEWSARCIGDPEGTLPLSEFRADEIDVIGNIFDNMELLQEGD